MKLIVNCAELVPSAILDRSIKDAIETSTEMHQVMLEAGREAVRTALAGGRTVMPIFGLGAVDQDHPEDFVEEMLDTVVQQFSLPTTKTTVLHDWMKGRHSEIDELNGFVVAEGARLGVPTPVNELLTRLGHRIERGELERGPANLPLLTDPRD
jgi:2-dehydropantoate 2-reductase